jgi:enterobactin synthetase component D
MPTPAASPALFPAFVAQYSLALDPEDPTDLVRQFPGIALPGSLNVAVRKRQMEFLAGRYCAREALRRLAPELADAPIAIGPNREPVWPPAVVGAITHVQHFASVAVARASDARGIGLDIERVMADELARSLVKNIAAPDEVAHLVGATGWSIASVLTLVFSAKETIFKCLYPEVRRYFDFRDASVLAIEPGPRRFSARLLRSIGPGWPAGALLEGRFERDERLVCTAMVLP